LHSSIELLDALNGLRKDPVLAPHILDVRGRGLMIGIEFASPNGAGLQVDPVVSAHSPKSLAKRVAQRCVDKGLLILSTSVYEVIRFIPPLNISQEDMRKGCELFAQAVREVVEEG
jgi:4-aminobutyrate aminotransferase